MSDKIDPQFGITRVLRPFAGFEAVYQGKGPLFPIMFSEKGVVTDTLAGTPGYSPQLINGLSVPMGQRLILWLPNIEAIIPFGTAVPYAWQLTWRMRNVFDFRTDRRDYHLPIQIAGVPDTTGGPSKPRVVIPACSHAVVYNQAEPVTVGGQVTQNLRIEDIASVGFATSFLPYLPNGSFGYYQQGILDPNISGASVAGTPFVNAYDIMALGDELMVGLWRVGTTYATWDFTGADTLLSQLFGIGTGVPYEYIGVYITGGVAP